LYLGDGINTVKNLKEIFKVGSEVVAGPKRDSHARIP
jgi:hypothetical protein